MEPILRRPETTQRRLSDRVHESIDVLYVFQGLYHTRHRGKVKHVLTYSLDELNTV